MAYTQITRQVIAANAVSAAIIANNAVNTRHIAANAVSADKFAANVYDLFATGTTVNTVQSNVYNLSSGLSGANTNITNLQTGLSGTNTNLAGNVAIFTGAFTGSNTRLAGSEANVIALQGGLTGANTINTNQTSGLSGTNTNLAGNVAIFTGAFTGSNTRLAGSEANVIALQGGISGTNTNLAGNVAIFTGAFTGSNTRLAGSEANVIALQGGLTGANTINTNQTSGLSGANTNITNLQAGLTGSNTRISGSESNVITLQTFATSTQSNIASIISGSSQFTGNVIMQKSLTILGNLYVTGAQVDLAVGSTSIYDSIITLNGNLSSSSPPPADTGFLFNRGSSDNVFIGIEVGESSDPHIHFSYTNSPGTNTVIATKSFIDVHANAYHAESSSLEQAAFALYNDLRTGIHFPATGITSITSNGVMMANVTSSGNLQLTTGYIQTTGSLFNSLDLKTASMSNGISLRSASNVGIFLDHNNDSTTDYFGVFTNTDDPSSSVDTAIFSIREQGANVYSKGNLNYISSNATTDVYSGNAIISTKVYSSGVELRSNDYATYLVVLGGLTGANTSITNLQTGLSGTNTNLSGNVAIFTGAFSGTNTNLSGNVAIFTGAFTGSNTRLAGAESNVIALQGGISGSNVRISGNESNIISLQGSVSGSNTRLAGAESNVIALQGGLNSANANIYSTYSTVTANTYVTYARLNANLNTVSSNTDSKLSLSGGTMSGNIAMGAKYINNLADPIQAQDAATRAYVLSVSGGTTLVQQYTTNISSGSSNVISISINTPLVISRILVSLSGIIQTPNIDFIHNDGNSSIQYTDASIPAGLTTVIQSWA